MYIDKGNTILLAEDEPMVRQLIAKILVDNGFTVITAENGAEAIEQYMDNRDQLDAILSDLRMPNVDGVKLAEFNYNNNALPFIVYTAVHDAFLAISLLRYGVQDYLEKPVNPKKLISVVNHSIHRYLFRHHGVTENSIYGNVDSIKIVSKSIELFLAIEWIRGKVYDILGNNETGRFLNYTNEFLVNAHEHGNMEIGEKEKSRLIENSELETEIKNREKATLKYIDVEISILENEIGLIITDEGRGFAFEEYLNMSDDTLRGRLEMPNGRGIYMSKNYFDSIDYRQHGSNVMLRKHYH